MNFSLKREQRLEKSCAPPWTAGWSVFTRPPSISGAPVMSDTSLRQQLVSKELSRKNLPASARNVEAGVADGLGRAAAPAQLDASCVEAMRQWQQACLVVDREESYRNNVS